MGGYEHRPVEMSTPLIPKTRLLSTKDQETMDGVTLMYISS